MHIELVHDIRAVGFDRFETEREFRRDLLAGAALGDQLNDFALARCEPAPVRAVAGWRIGFMVGNQEIVAALTKLKSYLDYGTFQPIQIASIVALNEAPDYPKEVNEIYQSRRNVLCEGLNRIGWDLEPPKGTMFVWAPIPEPYLEMGSLEFAKYLVTDAEVATSPGVGFGKGGEGFVRFALIENEQRIQQAVRNMRRVLTKLG